MGSCTNLGNPIWIAIIGNRILRAISDYHSRAAEECIWHRQVSLQAADWAAGSALGAGSSRQEEVSELLTLCTKRCAGTSGTVQVTGHSEAGQRLRWLDTQLEEQDLHCTNWGHESPGIPFLRVPPRRHPAQAAILLLYHN